MSDTIVIVRMGTEDDPVAYYAVCERHTLKAYEKHGWVEAERVEDRGHGLLGGWLDEAQEWDDNAKVLPNYEWRWLKSEEHKTELREKLKTATARAEKAEAKLTEIRELADKWAAYPQPINPRHITDTLRAILDKNEAHMDNEPYRTRTEKTISVSPGDKFEVDVNAGTVEPVKEDT